MGINTKSVLNITTEWDANADGRCAVILTEAWCSWLHDARVIGNREFLQCDRPVPSRLALEN